MVASQTNKPEELRLTFNDTVAILALLLFMVLLVVVRVWSEDKYEVRATDVVVALAPILLWLLLSGRIKKLGFGAGGITVEMAKEAILRASEAPVARQVTPVQLPVTSVEVGEKRSVGMLHQLLERRIDALRFTLGKGEYLGEVIKEYLTRLNALPEFRYVVIQNGRGRFVGVFDSRRLQAVLSKEPDDTPWMRFGDDLNGDDPAFLANLPGMVPAAEAVSPAADKKDVLAQMERLDRRWLPVVDEDGRFQGVVEQSRLTASLILDVARELKDAREAQQDG